MRITTVATHLLENGNHKIKFIEVALGVSEVWFPRHSSRVDALRWIETIMIDNNIAKKVTAITKNEKEAPVGVERIDWRITYEPV
jgi:hypothetical protein